MSSACAGQNAEVEQAVAPPHYVYKAWIGCGGEGFARSADGGAHFSKPVTLPDSSGSDDPAVAVAPDGTVYVSYLRYHDNYAYPVVAASFDHGASFSQAASLIPHVAGNWGDRDFIAAGRDRHGAPALPGVGQRGSAADPLRGNRGLARWRRGHRLDPPRPPVTDREPPPRRNGA